MPSPRSLEVTLSTGLMVKKAKEASACGTFCNGLGAAIGVAILSYGARYAYKQGMPESYHKSRMPEQVAVLDVDDSAQLKDVLYSGEPWLIQCYSGLPHEGQWLPRPFRLHQVFLESIGSSELRGIIKAGTLDCEKVLKSNKTLISKFGFVRRTQPLLIYAGGGDRPKQVPAASAASVYGVSAFVKPKASPRVKVARSQKALAALCGRRQPCLLSRLAPDSDVLVELARRYRKLEVVSIGSEKQSSLSWGRGDEVGETLEPEEAVFFGKRHSLLRADPDAPKPRKGAKPAPRLLRAHAGEEDVPSLSTFIEAALAQEPLYWPDDGFVRSPLPTLTALEQPKEKKPKAPKSKKPLDSAAEAERNAKRAKARAEAQRREEEQRQKLGEQRKQMSEEQRKQRELERRQQMAEEEEAASNILEEVDDDADADGAPEPDADEEIEEIEEEDFEDEDDGTDVMDLDA